MADGLKICCEDLEIGQLLNGDQRALPEGAKVDVSQVGALKEARETLERVLVSRPTIYELMNKLGITKA